jgi:hypothetical protein
MHRGSSEKECLFNELINQNTPIDIISQSVSYTNRLSGNKKTKLRSDRMS